MTAICRLPEEANYSKSRIPCILIYCFVSYNTRQSLFARYSTKTSRFYCTEMEEISAKIIHATKTRSNFMRLIIINTLVRLIFILVLKL